MTKLFEPIGDRSRWQVIYDLLVKLNVGGVVTYVEIGEALDLDPVVDRNKIAGAMRKAADEYLHENRRAVEVVPNIGYRVVEATEQLRIARRYQKKAGRALQAGHSQVTHFDPTGLEPNVRAGFELLARAFAQQADMNERFTRQGAKLRQELDSIQVRTERTEDELAMIRDRLARLEES